MQRRNVLKGLAAIAALSPFRSAIAAPFQRVRPGDPGWPRAQEWESLKAQVGGNLTKPTGLFSACAKDAKSGGCADALKEIGNPYFIGDQAGGTQTSGWLNAWEPQPSAYAVAAHRPEDVVAAVNFARQHRLRLVVKGGGHSYQGTSNAPDSLLVWMRPMRAITEHDRFVPQGCGPAPVSAVTMEAGAMWVDAYDAVTTKGGRYVQGGGCLTVGVPGLVQGGGFGSFSKRYGTAASSLLEAQIVTADGKLRIVNACSEPDLFWALKGGGGGSFGIVTSLTLKTHELPEFLGGAGMTIKAQSDQDFRRLLARFVDFYAGTLFNAQWGEHISVFPDNRLGISMSSAGLSTDEARAVWQPFMDWLQTEGSAFSTPGLRAYGSDARSYWDVQAMRKGGSTSIRVDTRPGAPPIHAWWNDNEGEVGVFLYGYDSLWLPQSLLAPEARPKLVDALFKASRMTETRLDFNKGLAGGAPDAIARSRDTATNPQVLSAFALALIATGGKPRYTGLPSTNDQKEAEEGARGVDRATAILRAIAPDAGSYSLESNFFDTHWREHYWGTNYPRLAGVKAKYDPDGLFIIHHGVGSEDWSEDGFTRRA